MFLGCFMLAIVVILLRLEVYLHLRKRLKFVLLLHLYHIISLISCSNFIL